MLVRPNQTCDGFVTDAREDREREKERERNGFESVSTTGYFKLFISSVSMLECFLFFTSMFPINIGYLEILIYETRYGSSFILLEM